MKICSGFKFQFLFCSDLNENNFSSSSENGYNLLEKSIIMHTLNFSILSYEIISHEMLKIIISYEMLKIEFPFL